MIYYSLRSYLSPQLYAIYCPLQLAKRFAKITEFRWEQIFPTSQQQRVSWNEENWRRIFPYNDFTLIRSKTSQICVNNYWAYSHFVFAIFSFDNNLSLTEKLHKFWLKKDGKQQLRKFYKINFFPLLKNATGLSACFQNVAKQSIRLYRKIGFLAHLIWTDC